jgi:thiopurine S-methyltransferase
METTLIQASEMPMAGMTFTGPDAQSFLQGQLSNDVAAMVPGAAASQLAGFHSPQGRVIALLELRRPTRDEFHALVPTDLAELVSSRLRRFVLRAKVAISLNAEVAPAPGRLSHAARISAGLPQVYAATTELFVAQMLNLDVIGAISFTKGCYTGQEIIARAHYRGRVKRRMQRFRSRAPCALKPGDSYRLLDGRSAQIVDAQVRRCRPAPFRCWPATRSICPTRYRSSTMDASFWRERWQRGETGFHQSSANTDLISHWPMLSLEADTSVFVPLCGKSIDMVWLRRRGHTVVGSELAEQAVLEFFVGLQLTPQRTRHGALERWHAGGYTIYCGDHFELSDAELSGCGAVYDRAALIALPEPMRARYASHMAAVLAPGTQALLITMCYPQQQMAPPPHSVCEPEVRRLYGDEFEVQTLASRDSLDGEPRLRARGLQALQEQSFLLRRR